MQISSLNLLRVISEQEGCPIEELNAGTVCDWFLKDKLKREQNKESAVLQWDDSELQFWAYIFWVKSSFSNYEILGWFTVRIGSSFKTTDQYTSSPIIIIIIIIVCVAKLYAIHWSKFNSIL